MRLSCFYIQSCNLRFLRVQVYTKRAMASINEGISSYFILSVVLELYRDSIVDKLVHNPFL